MEIRKTRPQELDAVMALYARARAFMAENGNPSQWGRKNRIVRGLKRISETETVMYVWKKENLQQPFFTGRARMPRIPKSMRVRG